MRYLVSVLLVVALGAAGCGDGDPCAGSPCRDSNPCTDDICVDGRCTFIPVAAGTTCEDDDENECTSGVCVGGVCEAPPLENGTTCDDSDGNRCTHGVCVRGVCESSPVEDGTDCYDGNDCTSDDACASGLCEGVPVEDGFECADGAGACEGGSCVGTFVCSVAGIRDAIAAGGGPHTFDCDGPTTMSAGDEILIYKDVILDGEGDITLDGGGRHRVLNVQAEVTLDGFTISRGYISDGNGGGIANGGQLTLLNSTVSNNTASLTSNTLARGFGGGIHNTGTLTLINSTVSGNTATGTHQPPLICWGGDCPPRFVGGDGGGIDNRGTLVLTNSTVSDNHAESEGGGIYNQEAAVPVRLTSSTVANNQGRFDIFGAASLRATVVSGDLPCAWGIESNGYNTESPGDTCGFDQATDQVNVSADDLKLGELADNGGPTMTHALGAGSVAIDQIPAVDCVDADGAPLTTDQRGEQRDSMCDVGAFEVQP